MQGKGIVKVFLVALAFFSLLQFLFIIPTKRVENRAISHAETICGGSTGEKQVCFKAARAAYLDSMTSVPVFSIWLLKSYTYQDLKQAQINFGLDLKGGMSVLLQVDLRDFVRGMSDNSTDPALEQALQKALEKQRTSQADFIALFAESWKEVAPGKPLNTLFKRNETLKEEINADTPDDKVASVLRERASQTFDLTYELLKQRIDKLGVVGPNVSPDKSRDLILVELPGVDNPQRARGYLQAAAKLEFWNVYRITDSGIKNAFIAANEKLKKLDAAGLGTTETPAVQDTSKTEVVQEDTTKTTPADTTGGVAQTNPADTTDKVAATDTTATDTSLAARTQGPLFDNFALNQSGSFGLAAMGTADKNKRKLVIDLLTRPGIKELFPPDIMFLWSRNAEKDPAIKKSKALSNTYVLYAMKKEPGKQTAPLEGDHVVEASINNDQNGKLGISLNMDSEGARIWGGMTEKAAVDQNRQIAIVLDSTVVSAPSVQNAIRDGRSSITGSFTVQEGQDLANILQIGKLPARTQIIQESLVGPSLGEKNINTSLQAMLGGFLLVLAFMVFYYGGAGVISILVLFLNVFLLLGAVGSFGTVLTLPGIAGIVLTIGMAVDANVIIFERVKEELRTGKSLAVAIKDGYRHSYSAIIDGNVTTFLTAVVLAVFGLGPIKGFAVVLMIGLATSVFTAVLVSRLMVDWWLSKGKTISFWRESTKNTMSNLNVDWMGYRKYFYVVSTVITLMGIVSFFTRGFDLSVDFKGGYSYNVEFQGQKVEAEAIREALTAPFGKTPVVKAFDTDNTYNIVTDYLVDDIGEDAPERVTAKLHEGLGALAGGVTLENFKNTDAQGTHITAFSKVGPTIADDLQKSAWKAIIFGLGVIFLYILFRFSKWQYSLGAVIATAHDAFMVIAIFSLLHGILPFPMEIDQAFVAAILTIIGYSVNDTVIVYDRIRENFSLYPDMPKNEVINKSINTTMSRTLFTSMTTMFTILILWLIGSGSIKGFAFALVLGIVIGTYSSVFIASPVMADLSKGDIRITNKPAREEKKKSSFRHAKAEKD